MEACCGKLACMGLLLDAGADVNAVDDSGSTPLHHALKKYRLDSVRYLLRRGALPGPRNNAGETPLEVADQQQILHACWPLSRPESSRRTSTRTLNE
nr:hypothetical protein BaRGS_023779 [Batillaria attramentaria]